MKSLILILVTLLIFTLPLNGFGSSSWKIFYDGVEVTVLACPQTREGKAFLNLTSLGPMMGIVIEVGKGGVKITDSQGCLLYTSPSPRDRTRSRMPSSA